jgi:hypothetical protein
MWPREAAIHVDGACWARLQAELRPEVDCRAADSRWPCTARAGLGPGGRRIQPTLDHSATDTNPWPSHPPMLARSLGRVTTTGSRISAALTKHVATVKRIGRRIAVSRAIRRNSRVVEPSAQPLLLRLPWARAKRIGQASTRGLKLRNGIRGTCPWRTRRNVRPRPIEVLTVA